MIKRVLVGSLLALTASCSVEPLDVNGKSCAPETGCPAPYACVNRVCIPATCADAGGNTTCEVRRGVCSELGVYACRGEGVRCENDAGKEILPENVGPSSFKCFPLLPNCTDAGLAPDGGMFCRVAPNCELVGILDGGSRQPDGGTCLREKLVLDCVGLSTATPDGGLCRTVPQCTDLGVVDGGATLPDAGSCRPPIRVDDCKGLLTTSDDGGFCRFPPDCSMYPDGPTNGGNQFPDGGSCIPPFIRPECMLGRAMAPDGGRCRTATDCADEGLLDGGTVLADAGVCTPPPSDCPVGQAVAADGGVCRPVPYCDDVGIIDGGKTLPDAGSCRDKPPLEDCPVGMTILQDGGVCRVVPDCVPLGNIDGGTTLSDAGSCLLPDCATLGAGSACDAGVGACSQTGQLVCQPNGTVRCNAVALNPGAEQCDFSDNNCDGIPGNAPWCALSLVGPAGGPGIDLGGPLAVASARFAGGSFLDVIDAGVVIATERYNHALRLINTTTNTVTTLAGNGRCGAANGPLATASFCEPVETIQLPDQSLLVSDSKNHRLRIIRNGTVSTLVGSTAGYANGSNAAVQFNTPTGLSLLSDGGVLVADTNNHVIRHLQVFPDGGATVSLYAGTPGVAGSGPGGDGTLATAKFRFPVDVSAPVTKGAAPGSDQVFVSDEFQIRRIKPTVTPAVETVVGQGATKVGDVDQYPYFPSINLPQPVEWRLRAARTRCNRPQQLTQVGAYLAFNDMNNHRTRILELDIDCADSTACGGFNSQQNAFGAATGGNYAFNDCPLPFLGGYPGSGPGFRNGNINLAGCNSSPSSLGDSPVGFFFSNTSLVSDTNHRIRSVTVNSFSVDNIPQNVADYAGGAAAQETANGDGRTAARLSFAQGLTRTASGALFWVEPRRHLVRQLQPNGTVKAVAGMVADAPGFVDSNNAAKVNTPRDVASAPNGDVFIADALNHVIRRVPAGLDTIETFSGITNQTVVSGYVDGPAASTRYNEPSYLAVASFADGGTSLFVSDTRNFVIRRVDLATGVSSLLAGTARDAGTDPGFPGTAGRLLTPGPIAASSQYVYIVDTYADGGTVVRRADSNNGILLPPPNFDFGSTPVTALAFDSTGALFAASPTTLYQLKTSPSVAVVPLVSAATGYQDGFLADGGTGALWNATGLVALPDRFYVTDGTARRIKQVWRGP